MDEQHRVTGHKDNIDCTDDKHTPSYCTADDVGEVWEHLANKEDGRGGKSVISLPRICILLIHGSLVC